MEVVPQELPCTGCIYPQDCGECSLRPEIGLCEPICEECGVGLVRDEFRLCGVCLRALGMAMEGEGC
jgi:hypothetical protein